MIWIFTLKKKWFSDLNKEYFINALLFYIINIKFYLLASMRQLQWYILTCFKCIYHNAIFSCKCHGTVTFLVGITSQGAISYTSETSGGWVSTKNNTEKSGFFNFILPRYFAGSFINTSIYWYWKTIAIELDYTLNIATVRIHIKKIVVINIFRKTVFKIINICLYGPVELIYDFFPL